MSYTSVPVAVAAAAVGGYTAFSFTGFSHGRRDGREERVAATVGDGAEREWKSIHTVLLYEVCSRRFERSRTK